ncbi:MAG TPA: hypothetical protein VHL58_09455 [Thermoanaerobaculia bacterium]|nr:hypothetical protein [Thermoanaerobaculia bacterium]
MKNVTITLDEETALWVRIRAAEKDSSVSRLVGEMLRERMNEERGYERAMEAYLKRRPRRLREKPSRLPGRENLHDRNRLR